MCSMFSLSEWSRWALQTDPGLGAWETPLLCICAMMTPGGIWVATTMLCLQENGVLFQGSFQKANLEMWLCQRCCELYFFKFYVLVAKIPRIPLERHGEQDWKGRKLRIENKDIRVLIISLSLGYYVTLSKYPIWASISPRGLLRSLPMRWGDPWWRVLIGNKVLFWEEWHFKQLEFHLLDGLTLVFLNRKKVITKKTHGY